MSPAKRAVSISALIVGIGAFCEALLLFLCFLWITMFSEPGNDFDIIGMLLAAQGVMLWCSFLGLCPIAAGLAIVALFIERNIWLGLLPLAFVVAGIGLFLACYIPDL